MAKPFNELRERLLRAGVAPRHVRRYLKELTDHLTDLRASEEKAGLSPASAEAAALARLGSADDLARAMVEQHHFQSWSVRAPWAAFCLAPLLWLTAAYFIACFVLWSGWTMFLPAADSPFGTGLVTGLANLYFQAGKAIYFGAPVFIGWAIGLIAARQRFKAIWPIAGLLLVACMGGSAQIQASRTAVPAGLGHISMGFNVFEPSAPAHILVILSLTVLPYLVWRLAKANSTSLASTLRKT